jgi:hypothetical protein
MIYFVVGKTVIFISAFSLLTLKQARTSRWRFVAIWCQNVWALNLKRYIEMTLFNGLLAKIKLNQTGAFLYQVTNRLEAQGLFALREIRC